MSICVADYHCNYARYKYTRREVTIPDQITRGLRVGARAYVEILRAGPQTQLEMLEQTERIATRLVGGRVRAPQEPEPGRSSQDDQTDATDPAELMSALLRRGVSQSAEQGRRDLHLCLLGSLLPDEAQILATLSGGAPVAVVHVEQRVLTGRGRRVLDNATIIGNLAPLAVPRLAPVYVARLLELGLVELGPEDPSLSSDYEILSARADVRAALSTGKDGPLPVRAVRATLRMSGLGAELWDACRGSEPR